MEEYVLVVGVVVVGCRPRVSWRCYKMSWWLSTESGRNKAGYVS